MREATQVRIGDGLYHYDLGEYFLFIPFIIALPGSHITFISLYISEVRTVNQKGGCLLCVSASYVVWS